MFDDEIWGKKERKGRKGDIRGHEEMRGEKAVAREGWFG